MSDSLFFFCVSLLQSFLSGALCLCLLIWPSDVTDMFLIKGITQFLTGKEDSGTLESCCKGRLYLEGKIVVFLSGFCTHLAFILITKLASLCQWLDQFPVCARNTQCWMSYLFQHQRCGLFLSSPAALLVWPAHGQVAASQYSPKGPHRYGNSYPVVSLCSPALLGSEAI